jgi:hypothetical protein
MRRPVSAWALHELEHSQGVERGQAPDGARSIDCLGDLALGIQKEACGVQEAPLAFHHRTRGLADLLGVCAVENRVRGNAYPVDQSLSGLPVVNRQGYDLGIVFGEEWDSVFEVNQLLTTIGSPVASIHEDNAP